jgi:hypothetical protein
MTDARTGEERLTPQFLADLAGDEPPAGLARLDSAGLASLPSAEQLTVAALAQAESAPEQAARWLALAEALRACAGGHPGLQAQIAYAQARLRLQAAGLD